MKRLVIHLSVISIAGLLATGLTGCGREEKKKFKEVLPPTPSGGSSSGTDVAKVKIKPGTGVIHGKVTYDGTPPTPDPSFPAKLKNHADSACCDAADAKPWEKTEQTWLVGPNKEVRNVLIYLNPPEGAEFEAPPATTDAVLDQPHCVYIPHVLALTPGQKLVVKNSATVNHNTKLKGDPRINEDFGATIAPGGSKTVTLKPQRRPLTASCDFHGWMQAYIWVMPHPYVAVTGEDGTYKIENVPEGELSLVAWHEGAGDGGFFYGGEAGTKITLAAGEKRQIDLKVKAK
ncbi:MAG: hypothetical protein NZO58_06670, partial [Gemmataceae bacterium]|nr:hypothetical protein [Gemmataceae bacterium]